MAAPIPDPAPVTMAYSHVSHGWEPIASDRFRRQAPGLQSAPWKRTRHPIATSPWTSPGSPKPPPWPAGRWLGRGDKNAADQAAVDAMRLVLNTVAMDGIVVIGEGEKDEAPMLYNGEEIGHGRAAMRHRRRPDRRHHPHLARPQRRDRGDLGGRARHDVRPRPVRLHGEDRGRARRPPTSSTSTRPVTANLQAVAKAKGEEVRDVTAVILDRDRHAEIVRECREAGARVKLIHDGDVAGAIAAAWPDSGTDILFGIGGTPEGVIAACALKALGGAILGRLTPRNDEERRAALDGGYDVDRVLTTDDLVTQRRRVLRRHRHLRRRPRAWASATSPTAPARSTVVMRSKTGTIRTIDATHRWHKLKRYSPLQY